MIKAIVIDDETKSRQTLRSLLQQYCPEVEVIAEADGVESGLAILERYKPDVLFLDIQMTDGTGFKLLENLNEIEFEVIFATAYDQFAIKAIRYSALDYLLKPIVADELTTAVSKVKEKKEQGLISKNVKVLLENVKEKNGEPKKIVLSTSEGMHVLEVSDILRCESDDYYTRFFLVSGKTIMVSKTLKENEELLSAHNFVRPHKSHLINLKYLKSYLKIDGGYLLMTDGTKVPVSRRKKEMILSVINQL